MHQFSSSCNVKNKLSNCGPPSFLESWQLQKKPTNWAVCKHIVHHCVTIIPTMHWILTNPFDRVLNWELHSVHETNDVFYHWFPLLDHVCKFHHLCLIRGCTLAIGWPQSNHTVLFSVIFIARLQMDGVMPKIRQRCLYCILLPR